MESKTLVYLQQHPRHGVGDLSYFTGTNLLIGYYEDSPLKQSTSKAPAFPYGGQTATQSPHAG